VAEPRDVFIVCNNTDAMGGLQRWAHHLARLLVGRGHRVTLVGVTHAAEPQLYRSEESYDVRVLHHDWRPPALRHRPRTLSQRLNAAAWARDLWRTAEMRKGVDRLSSIFASARRPGGVIIAAQVWAMEWVARADTGGMKVIGMSHESYDASRRSTRHRRGKEFFAGTDRFLTLTAEDADAWARDGMTNADHMPNPLHVSPNRFPTLAEPVVACVGRLSYEKGVDMLLEAWERVAPEHPDWRLHIYGDGPAAPDLRHQAESAGLSGSVEFKGMTDDIEAALTEASIFALPSRDEGFPMSVLESMAYGLPTVGFDCAPGVRELLNEEENGLLAERGDIFAFAEALDRLMGDAALRRSMGAAARNSVLRFHPDTVLDRWERLFSLLHRDGSADEFPSALPAMPLETETTRTPVNVKVDS